MIMIKQDLNKNTGNESTTLKLVLKVFRNSCFSLKIFGVYCLLAFTTVYSYSQPADVSKIWVGTWSTAQQLVEPYNVPPSPGLTSNSLRQIVRVSIGGDTLRLKLSNEYSSAPVTMKSVQVALSKGGSEIFDSTTVELKFNGKPEVTMDAHSTVFSDPFHFKLAARTDLAITIYFGETSSDITGHPGSRTTSYLLPGNDPSVTNFSDAIQTDHWYTINTIDVLLPASSGCVAILGNSITDGRGSTTNQQNRWPDILSERLLNNEKTKQVGVLNLGIGGNCVLKNCLGPSGISRFQNDIVDQSGVRAMIIFEGVNDIGGVKSAEEVSTIATDLITAYNQMIDTARAKKLLVYGATIMAFKGNGYYNEHSEACRNKVNEWIRNSGRFDAVIDFDSVTRSNEDFSKLAIATYQDDGLHPTAEGYRIMAESIDLHLFDFYKQSQPIIPPKKDKKVKKKDKKVCK